MKYRQAAPGRGLGLNVEVQKLDRWWDRILVDEPQLRHATDEQVRSIFERRAIDENVWRGRPFVPYDAGDWDAVLAADPAIGALSAGPRAYLHKIVNQRPGLVMRRASWPGRPPIVAQLRPFKFKELGFDERALQAAYGAKDEGVFSTSAEHNHASPEWHYHEGDHVVVVNRARTRKKRGTPEEHTVADHVNESHDGAAQGEREVHPHRLRRRDHIAREHGGNAVEGRHEHASFAKYVYPPGEEAKRIDVHPMAWPLLEAGGDVCYFALEGLLKNDAILSTVAAVVNVGSVTLWEDDARGWLAENYLRRFSTVVVVPDSDGSGNDLVSGQAAELAAALRGHGVRDVVVASPTAKCEPGPVCEHLERDTGRSSKFTGLQIKLPDEEHKRGVDDFLGDGEDLRSMIVEVARERPPVPSLVGRRDAAQRDLPVVRHLQGVVTARGRAVVTERGVGDATGLGRMAANRALHSIEDRGLAALSSAPVLGERLALPPPLVELAPVLVPQRDRVTLGEYLARRQL